MFLLLLPYLPFMLFPLNVASACTRAQSCSLPKSCSFLWTFPVLPLLSVLSFDLPFLGQPISCLYRFAYSGYFIQVDLYTIWFFVPGFFHLVFSFVQIIAGISTSVLFIAQRNSTVWINHNLFIQSSNNGRSNVWLLGYYEYAFGSLWHLCTGCWVDISFQFPWVVLRSGMAGSKLILVGRDLVLFTGWGWRRGSSDRYREELGRRKLALEKGYFLQHPSFSLLAQP